MTSWDLKEEDLPNGNAKVMIGGSIEEMQINCWTGAFNNSYKARVKLTVVVVDSARRKIITKSKVESSSSRDDVFFQEKRSADK